MRVLVGWTDEAEAETLNLILNVEPNEANVVTDADEFRRIALDADEFRRIALDKSWDTILWDLTFPNPDESFALFNEVRKRSLDRPIVGAWLEGDINRLCKFVSAGLHSHIMRDSNGDFIFLLTTIMEAAHQGAIAQRASILAERLREEVDSVRRLQESVIPQDLPIQGGYTMTARYEPAQIRVLGATPVVMAGGDYYDAFSLGEDKLVLLVGDASGHGVKACMSIMTMHTLIRMIRDETHPDPAHFVGEVNRRLCTNDIVQDEGGFITLIYSTLNISTNEFEWTCAGHPMPILQDLTTNEVRVLGSEELGGLPLAIEEDWDYELLKVVIPNNSRLLIYSDGLDEAFPADQEDGEHFQFGMEGIIRTLKETRDAPLKDALERLFAESEAATNGTGRHDDTSVLMLQRIDETGPVE